MRAMRASKHRADVFQLFAHAVAYATLRRHRAARARFSRRAPAARSVVGGALMLDHHARALRPGARTDFGGYNAEWWRPGCHILPGTSTTRGSSARCSRATTAAPRRAATKTPSRSSR